MSLHSDTRFPSQPVSVLTLECCVLSVEEKNTNFIFLCLTGPGIKLTTYSVEWDRKLTDVYVTLKA